MKTGDKKSNISAIVKLLNNLRENNFEEVRSIFSSINK